MVRRYMLSPNSWHLLSGILQYNATNQDTAARFTIPSSLFNINQQFSTVGPPSQLRTSSLSKSYINTVMRPSCLAETYRHFGGTSQDSTLQDGSSRFFRNNATYPPKRTQCHIIQINKLHSQNRESPRFHPPTMFCRSNLHTNFP